MADKSAEAAERDGGQAFPQPITLGPSGDAYPAFPGMTLRDWFAGQAMAAIISKILPLNDSGETQAGAAAADIDHMEGVIGGVCRGAYPYADAMIAERSK